MTIPGKLSQKWDGIFHQTDGAKQVLFLCVNTQLYPTGTDQPNLSMVDAMVKDYEMMNNETEMTEHKNNKKRSHKSKI